MQWKGESKFCAIHWHWTVKSWKFIPVLTDLETAPKSIFKIIRCQCKTDCSNWQCGCQKKNNLPCTYACGSLSKNKTIETLAILVFFQIMKKTSVIIDQNNNSGDHRRESTLTLLHGKSTYPSHCGMFLLKLG